MKKFFKLTDDYSLHSRQEVQMLQNTLLAEQVRYSRENSPFYRKKFTAFPDRNYKIPCTNSNYSDFNHTIHKIITTLVISSGAKRNRDLSEAKAFTSGE